MASNRDDNSITSIHYNPYQKLYNDACQREYAHAEFRGRVIAVRDMLREKWLPVEDVLRILEDAETTLSGKLAELMATS